MSSDTTPVGDWRDNLLSLTYMSGFAFVFQDNGPKPREFPQLLEGSAEQQLRGAAAAGNPVAMERLGARLLYGEGLSIAVADGIAWLERSAKVGNPVAMHMLAEHWLGTSTLEDRIRESEAWLVSAAQAGYLPAQVSLGEHLLEGERLTRDSDRALNLLTDAASRGNRLAHSVLAASYLNGRGLPQDSDAGVGWLKRLGGIGGLQISALAAHLHGKALLLPSAQRRRMSEYAGAFFAEAVRQGHESDEVNLAYLLRRGEIEVNGRPSLDSLLEKHVAADNPHALVNQALRLARGVQCEPDWQQADSLIARIAEPSSIVSWWSERALEGDPEGHLTVGWLVRHGLSADPHRRSVPERFAEARAGGWAAPEFLVQQVGAPRN